MSRRSRRRPPGVILILVSAFLVVLASLSFVLANLLAQGRGVAQAGVGTVRAALLARSGVEYGMSRLSRAPDPNPRPGMYRDDWTCRDGAGVRLEDLRNPSYHHGERWDDAPTGDGRYTPADGWGAADDLDGNGRYTGWTGRLRGAYGRADTFTLRIEDESGKINVNGGLLDAGNRDADGIPDHRDVQVGPASATAVETGRGWNGQLRRILDALGTVREDADGDGTLDPGEDWDGDGALDPASLGIAELGRVILENRPSGGYASVAAVEWEVARATGLPRSDLTPYVTVSSWIDRAVIRPNGVVTQGSVVANSLLKTGRAPLALEEGGRPPVNLNAAPGPVLVALIGGLRGGSWFDDASPVRYEIPPAMAGRIAGEILARRPFATWSAFGVFCDSLAPGVIAGMAQASAIPSQRPYHGGNLCGTDLLKANFDPNTRSNKEFPDDLLHRFIDKTDLEVWSTEGCLASTGSFRISSLGRLRDTRGGVVAEGRCDAVTSQFSLVRHTSQADFVGGRALSDVPRYLSLADVSYRTTGASASWNDWGVGQGVAVMTYPCGVAALPAKAARHDGAVGLATIETEPLDPAGGTLAFLHHFDDGWQADYGASPAREDGPSDGSLQTDASEGVWPAPPQEPGTLYPDGVHSQTGRAPAYLAGPHLPEAGRRGCVSFWLKRPSNRRVSQMFSCVRWVGPVADQKTQCLFFAGGGGLALATGGLMAESVALVGSNDAGAECGYESGLFGSAMRLRPSLRWRLIAGHWDTDQDTNTQAILPVNLGARGAGTAAPPYGDFNPAVGSEDLVDPLGPSRVFAVGGQPGRDGFPEYANQVIDEVVLCDFGDDPATSLNAMRAWADLRYAEGRYYKGNDGEFLSPVVTPAGGAPVRVAWASWTGYLPSDPRKEATFSGSDIAETPGTRVSDPTLAGARIEVELADAAGNPLIPPRPLAASGPVGISLPSFRYRVRFLPTPTWADDTVRANQPVLETPFFDDITFAFFPAGGPRLLAWEERS